LFNKNEWQRFIPDHGDNAIEIKYGLKKIRFFLVVFRFTIVNIENTQYERS